MLQKDCICLHCHPTVNENIHFPTSHPYWLWSVLSKSNEQKSYINLLQICISVVTSQYEHASIYLLITCISSANGLSILFAYFPIRLLSFSHWFEGSHHYILILILFLLYMLTAIFSKLIAFFFFLACLYTFLHHTKGFLM